MCDRRRQRQQALVSPVPRPASPPARAASPPPPPPSSPPPPSYYTNEDSRPASPADTISGATWQYEPSMAPSASSSATYMPLSPTDTVSEPPRYGADGEVLLAWQPASAQAEGGAESTTYSFAQLTYRSMAMVSADGAPLYHVAVEVNCFRPASHITVLRRGASESGPYVGEFEIGLPARHNRVTLGGSAKLLTRPTLYWGHSISRAELPRLRWAFDDVALRWDPVTTVQAKHRPYFKCTTPDPSKKKVSHHVASFYPPDPLRAVSGARPRATLTVEKDYVHLLDHIVVTVLMLQQDNGFLT